MVEFKKYIKLPVEVEAFQVQINEECFNKIYELTNDPSVSLAICDNCDNEIAFSWEDLNKDDNPHHFVLITEETILVFNKGDYLVKGVDGSIYPVKEKTFWKVYNEINPNEKGALSW